MNETLFRQQSNLYPVPFRNLDSSTMPAYGVGLVTNSSVDDNGLFIPSVVSFTASKVCGMIVNGATSVASSGYGEGFWANGPVLCLYDTADGTPVVGDTWGPKYAGSFKLNKGYAGFMCVSSLTAGSGSTARGFFMPQWINQQRIIGGMRRSSFTITNADSATQIIPFNLAAFGTYGDWPSISIPGTLDLDTSTGRATVQRAGLWKASAWWSSEGTARASSPFQSKIHRANIALYLNASRGSVSGGQTDWYHFSLANADTSPTAGVAMRVNGYAAGEVYCAVGDILDWRLTVSEVTADSGTTNEGYVLFQQAECRFEFVGEQQWRNDY